MKQIVLLALIGVVWTTGCASHRQAKEMAVENSVAGTPPANDAPPATPSATDKQILARVNGQPITLRQVIEPLLESRGLALLLNIAQLDMAKQDAREAHVAVTPQDIQHEQELTLDKMFHDADQKEQDQLADAEAKHQLDKAEKLRAQIRKDRDQLLEQYLNNQHFTRQEYDIVIELNAYLRKAAQSQTQGQITDEMVQKEFGLEYGETVKVRFMQLANMREVQEAQRRLKAGEDFAQVAKGMSRHTMTAPLGGEMPPFSLQSQTVPQEFRQLAFSLQPGQISDPLLLQDSYYLIKLEQKFPPKAVRFDKVKDSLRESMYDKLTEMAMNRLRDNLGKQVMLQLTIDDPLLAKQFEELKAKREGAIKERQKMDEQWKKERQSATQPSTAPTTIPATTMPTTSPVAAQ